MFFGLGALTVGILTRLGVVGPVWMEWLLFPVTSVVYLLLFRRRLQQRVQQTTRADEVDTLIGAPAVTKERIPPGDIGRVELRGTVWNARNNGTEAIEPGRRCRVVGVDGLLVFVQPE
jgi:membrane protein implicated in regulation of membrane protease activity